MISIECPDDNAEAVYKRAAARTKNLALRGALLSVAPFVKGRASDYLNLAPAFQLDQLMQQDPAGCSKIDLAKVYDRVLVKGNERPLYDRIKASAKFGRCPLCDERVVKTLDHYLPKAEYPEFGVYPTNLVPCCSDCNKAKHTHLPNSADHLTFHPYFDDWQEYKLLQVNIEIDETVEVEFIIDPGAGVPDLIANRAANHFKLLELASLYGANAAAELAESKMLFREWFESGEGVLRDELRRMARSRSRGNGNNWKAVLYEALASNDDFCEGGFEHIEE